MNLVALAQPPISFRVPAKTPGLHDQKYWREAMEVLSAAQR